MVSIEQSIKKFAKSLMETKQIFRIDISVEKRNGFTLEYRESEDLEEEDLEE